MTVRSWKRSIEKDQIERSIWKKSLEKKGRASDIMFFAESDLLSSSYSASPFYLAAHYDILTESQTRL